MTHSCYALFHMNLAFSAVKSEDRLRVIQQCYTPLLDLVEAHDFRLGIECNAWSLLEIKRLAPEWLDRFKVLLAQGKCCLVASGFIQLIGPLVPYKVNRWNQILGLHYYKDLLGVRPRLVLVNEMAFSSSLVDLYLEHGFQGLVMERENVALKDSLALKGSWLARGNTQECIPVLFSGTVLFQKLQRYIHGDIDFQEYWQYLTSGYSLVQARPIYCSDTEIFGYRPKRYHYEPQVKRDEWGLMAELFQQIGRHYDWVSPEQALVKDLDSSTALAFTSAAHPLIVKKQPKYNVARWAVTGRDDLFLNTLCYRISQQLDETAAMQQKETVCRLFSSDLRTHIQPQRWHEALAEAEALCHELGQPLPGTTHVPAKSRVEGLPAGITLARKGFYLEIQSSDLRLRLNSRRGLAISELSFGDGPALVGTLPHGYFQEIALAADFYSGSTVIEVPGQLLRITDLEPVEPEFFTSQGRFHIRGKVTTPLGDLVKTLSLKPGSQCLWLRFEFPGWSRPLGTVRVGHFTLLPAAWSEPIQLSCFNGGQLAEHFTLDEPCHHHQAVSSLISATTGLGATTGQLGLQSGNQTLNLCWDPGACAAFPMLWHQPIQASHITRLIFSLAELDDTRTAGGHLLPLEIRLDAHIKGI